MWNFTLRVIEAMPQSRMNTPTDMRYSSPNDCRCASPLIQVSVFLQILRKEQRAEEEVHRRVDADEEVQAERPVRNLAETKFPPPERHHVHQRPGDPAEVHRPYLVALGMLDDGRDAADQTRDTETQDDSDQHPHMKIEIGIARQDGSLSHQFQFSPQSMRHGAPTNFHPLPNLIRVRDFWRRMNPAKMGPSGCKYTPETPFGCGAALAAILPRKATCNAMACQSFAMVARRCRIFLARQFASIS